VTSSPVVKHFPLRDGGTDMTVTLHEDDTVWVGDSWDNLVQLDGDRLHVIADALLAVHVHRGRVKASRR
jgi:hypothetical protein